MVRGRVPYKKLVDFGRIIFLCFQNRVTPLKLCKPIKKPSQHTHTLTVAPWLKTKTKKVFLKCFQLGVGDRKRKKKG